MPNPKDEFETCWRKSLSLGEDLSSDTRVLKAGGLQKSVTDNFEHKHKTDTSSRLAPSVNPGGKGNES